MSLHRLAGDHCGAAERIDPCTSRTGQLQMMASSVTYDISPVTDTPLGSIFHIGVALQPV